MPTESAFALAGTGPSYVQITATGEWETADRLAGADDARAYLASFGDAPPEALGIEVLWEGPPVCFCGARIDADRFAALPALVGALTGDDVTPGSALSALSGGALGPVEGAQLGAVNAWLSVGPVTVWDGAQWQDPADVLTGRADLRACRYPVALEVAHRHAYYAAAVSRRAPDGRHVVDPAVLDDLVQQLRTAVVGSTG